MTLYQKRVGRFRLKPEPQDIPSIKEGVPHGKFWFTAKDSVALEACLKRRGLNMVRAPRGGDWELAA